MWFKKKVPTQLNSDEFENLAKKVVLLVADVDLLNNKYQLLLGSYRKLNLKISKSIKEESEEEIEKSIRGQPIAI